MRKSLLLVTLSVLAAVAPTPASAQNEEWQGLYYLQCGDCHGGAKELLETRIVLKGGLLLGRASNQDMRVFLGNHFGNRDKADVATIHMELLRVAKEGGRFQQQCAICHVKAEALARESLIWKDGALYGRYSGRRIGDYLTRHGRLATPDDAAFFEEVLRRNLPGGG
jgi:hypothetical protein